MGRPPKPKDEKLSAQVLVKMTEGERKMLDRMARESGISLSALMMKAFRKDG
jgi:hypothetical protein